MAASISEIITAALSGATLIVHNDGGNLDAANTAAQFAAIAAGNGITPASAPGALTTGVIALTLAEMVAKSDLVDDASFLTLTSDVLTISSDTLLVAGAALQLISVPTVAEPELELLAKDIETFGAGTDLINLGLSNLPTIITDLPIIVNEAIIELKEEFTAPLPPPASTPSPSPTFATPPTATVDGCPHFTMFDGLHFDFQGAGEFIAARSTVPGDTFQVQMRIEPEGSLDSAVSIITQIAVQVGSDRVTFAPNRGLVVSVDGTSTAINTGSPLTLAGGTVTEVSADQYRVALNTGEVVTVDPFGDGMGLAITLAPTDAPGSVQGLLGPDEGQANDFQLPDGTVLPQPLTQDQLYHQFADAWRVTDSNSLLDYAPGQTTATFTDTTYPREILTLADFSPDLVAQAAALAAAAGITDPTVAADAEFDYLSMGNPSYFTQDAAVAALGATTPTSAVITQPAAPPPSIGLLPVDPQTVETTGATTPVTFLVNLTSAATTDTVVDYTVASPATTSSGKSFLTAADFGGALPSGSVTITAGQTAAAITIDVPNSAIGLTPDKWLMVTASSPGNTLYSPTAQAEILNNQPVAGIPATPAIELLSGAGTLTRTGNAYTLDLGQVTQNASLSALQFAIANMAPVSADNLSSVISALTGDGFDVSGTQLPAAIMPGVAYQGLYFQPDPSTLGAHTETLTLKSNDTNDTGYSAGLPDLTLTVEDTVTAATSGTTITLQPGTTTSLQLGQDSGDSFIFAGTSPADAPLLKFIGQGNNTVGALIVNAGATGSINQNSAAAVEAQGGVQINGGSLTDLIQPGATLTLDAASTINNGGSFVISSAESAVTLTGTVTLGASGANTLDIGGVTGTDYTTLNGGTIIQDGANDATDVGFTNGTDFQINAGTLAFSGLGGTANSPKILNDGVVTIASGGSLDVTSAIDPSSTGVFQLAGNASLEIAVALGINTQIQFLGAAPANKLAIDNTAAFGTQVATGPGMATYTGPLLENFTAGDVIDLKGTASNPDIFSDPNLLGMTYSAATGDLLVVGRGGDSLATLRFQNSSLGAGIFHFASDGAGGTLITHS